MHLGPHGRGTVHQGTTLRCRPVSWEGKGQEERREGEGGMDEMGEGKKKAKMWGHEYKSLLTLIVFHLRRPRGRVMGWYLASAYCSLRSTRRSGKSCRSIGLCLHISKRSSEYQKELCIDIQICHYKIGGPTVGQGRAAWVGLGGMGARGYIYGYGYRYRYI